MAEYIEREALLQDIEDSVRFTAKTGTISPEMRGANKVIDRIKCAPVADVAPVRHGHLVTITDRWATYHRNCSECNAQLPWNDHPNYCPDCGAKMDEEVAE